MLVHIYNINGSPPLEKLHFIYIINWNAINMYGMEIIPNHMIIRKPVLIKFNIGTYFK